MTPIVNLPSVGKNMSDHVLLENLFQVNSSVSDTYQDFLAPDALSAELAQWNKDHTGRAAEFGARQIGWLRLPSTDAIFKQFKDPALGPKSAHYELIFCVRSTVFYVDDDLADDNL